MSTLRTNAITTTGGKPILNSTGSILQVAYGESTTQVIVAQQTYTVIHSVSLTSVSPNSRYFITGYAHGYNATSNNRSNIGFSVTISGVTTRISGVDGGSGDSWGTNTSPVSSSSGAIFARSAVYTSTAAAGTSLTFNLLGTGYDAANTYFNYSGYNHRSTLTVIEISS